MYILPASFNCFLCIVYTRFHMRCFGLSVVWCCKETYTSFTCIIVKKKKKECQPRNKVLISMVLMRGNPIILYREFGRVCFTLLAKLFREKNLPIIMWNHAIRLEFRILVMIRSSMYRSYLHEICSTDWFFLLLVLFPGGVLSMRARPCHTNSNPCWHLSWFVIILLCCFSSFPTVGCIWLLLPVQNWPSALYTHLNGVGIWSQNLLATINGHCNSIFTTTLLLIFFLV